MQSTVDATALELERALIGAMLADFDTAQTVLKSGVSSEWFVDPKHSAIFAAIRHSRTKCILEVKELLAGDRHKDVADTLNSFVDAACISSQIEWHVDKLRDAHHRRELRRLGLEISEKAAGDGDLAVMLAQARDRLDQIGNDTGGIDDGLPQSVDVTLWHDADLPPPDPVLIDAFDLGTKALVVGPSKARKSFFLLQLLLSIAAGKDSFLSWNIKQARRVLFLNLEIPAAHFQRRVRRMMRSMNIEPGDLGGRFHLINARGMEPNDQTDKQITESCHDHGAEIVCVDPVYKLLTGDESKQEHVKPLLRLFDQIANESGATVLYSHHGTKGIAGDRQTIDRAAGSGVLARDFDWMASLAHHQTHRETGLMVCEQIARSYAPKDAFSIRWHDEGLFVVDDAEPVLLTSRNADKSGKAGPALTAEDAFKVCFVNGATYSARLIQALRDRGFTKQGASNIIDDLIGQGRIAKLSVGFPRRVIIGTPDALKSCVDTHGGGHV